MNMTVFKYVDRGLFECHKMIFKFLMATRILIKDTKLSNNDVGLLFKKPGAIENVSNPFAWMD